MAIAPITGKLRKRFWLDIGCASALGLSAGYAYWYGYHLKALAQQENFYIKLEKEKARNAAE